MITINTHNYWCVFHAFVYIKVGLKNQNTKFDNIVYNLEYYKYFFFFEKSTFIAAKYPRRGFQDDNNIISCLLQLGFVGLNYIWKTFVTLS